MAVTIQSLNLAKCHANVYAQPLEKIGLPAPARDTDAFIHRPSKTT